MSGCIDSIAKAKNKRVVKGNDRCRLETSPKCFKPSPQYIARPRSCTKVKSRTPDKPRIDCLSKSLGNLKVDSDSSTESSEETTMSPMRSKRKLPPIGVFWDIENCQVPKSKSAIVMVQNIRALCFDGYREAEFIVVCDVKKENPELIQELNDSQVNLIHVASTSKNAADEKLRQAMRRFAETHSSPAALVLISSDINFAPDLSDLRYRKGLHIILIHQTNVADALIACANEHYDYSTIVERLPVKDIGTTSFEQCTYDLIVTNLPISVDVLRLKSRLKQLSNNCGGKIVLINQDTAILRFVSINIAIRAQKRMDGEDVFGQKISVKFPGVIRSAAERPHNVFKPYAALRRPTKPAQLGHALATTSYGGGAVKKTYALAVSKGTDSNSKPFYYSKLDEQQSYDGLPNRTAKSDCGDDEMVYETFGGGAFERSSSPKKSQNFDVKVDFPQEHTENFFPPIDNIPKIQSNSPVEVIVKNLDTSMGKNELKSALLNIVKEHVMVLDISIQTQSDGLVAALIRLSNAQDGQTVISLLRRRKLGSKRLLAVYSASSSATLTANLRSQVVALLQEVPGSTMPLFTFREVFLSRYNCSVSLSELCKLRDVCTVSEEEGGRMIALASSLRTSPSPFIAKIDVSYCTIHCPRGLVERGWAELEVRSLPNVKMRLSELASCVQKLICSHGGILPLSSFEVCYYAEFKNTLNVDENGVPLEHLVTCVKGVEIRTSPMLVKYLVWAKLDENQGEDSNASQNKMPNHTSTQLAQFSREIIDLLKTVHHCQLPFGKFVPAYHHHFGKQCRVADYGFVKLVDLLEAVSGVVQIIGEGNRKAITPTHATQIRRFTADLLKMLKTQTSKQLTLSEFAGVYERIFSRAFDPADYGMCHLEDLISEAAQKAALTVTCAGTGTDLVIALPKREQTAAEVRRTKQFAVEVVELLKHAPQCKILFHKFVPAYHHHFNHQCKVSDYGFTRLIELFEAIPDVVKIEVLEDGERLVCLTPREALNVLNEQIVKLLKTSDSYSISLQSLPAMFLNEYGFPLRPKAYGCGTLPELIGKFPGTLRLIEESYELAVTLAWECNYNWFGLRVWALLVKFPHRMAAQALIALYNKKFNQYCTITQLQNQPDILEVQTNEHGNKEVSLTSQFVLVARIYNLLLETKGSMSLNDIEHTYNSKYGEAIAYMEQGFNSLQTFLSRLQFLVEIEGTKNKTIVVLRKQIKSIGLTYPSSSTEAEDAAQAKNVIDWPPPPMHTIFSKVKAAAPPKPDTPPLHNAWETSSVWSPPAANSSMNLKIPMPEFNTPKLDNKRTVELISPKKLMQTPACKFCEIAMKPPEPSALPLPNVSLFRSLSADHTYEPDESESFQVENKFGVVGLGRNKQKSRLSAHFQMQLN